MKRQALSGAVALAIILTGALNSTPAAADSNDGTGHDTAASWLTPEQREGLFRADSPINVTSRATVGRLPMGGVRVAAATSCGKKAMKTTLHRGNVMMWAEDTLKFQYSSCKKKIYSSSLSQRAGYVFPNIAKAEGTSRYYRAKAKHKWHGRYTIGAGVVTPWGDVTVYSVDVRSDWTAGVIKLPDGQVIGHAIGEWE